MNKEIREHLEYLKELSVLEIAAEGKGGLKRK